MCPNRFRMESEIVGFAQAKLFMKENIMSKKRFFCAIILVIALLVLGSCVSAPVAKQAYPGGVEMYPAVYGTFSELYPNARYLDIDFYNNKYVLTGITGYALTTPVSYDMIVQLTSAGEIDISYGDIWMMDPKTRRWSRSEAFGFYNFNAAAVAIAAKMAEIANDAATLERHEKAAMADLKFIHTILNNFTGLAFNDFINKYAKGSIFNINGTVSDVKEANRTIDGTTYSYSVTLTQKLREEREDAFISSLLSESIYCTFYTNQDDVIRLSKTAVLSVKGVLIGASQGALSLRLELVDTRQ